MNDPFENPPVSCSPALNLVTVGEVIADPQFPMWGPNHEHLRGGMTDEIIDSEIAATGNLDRLYAKSGHAMRADIDCALFNLRHGAQS